MPGFAASYELKFRLRLANSFIKILIDLQLKIDQHASKKLYSVFIQYVFPLCVSLSSSALFYSSMSISLPRISVSTGVDAPVDDVEEQEHSRKCYPRIEIQLLAPCLRLCLHRQDRLLVFSCGGSNSTFSLETSQPF